MDWLALVPAREGKGHSERAKMEVRERMNAPMFHIVRRRLEDIAKRRGIEKLTKPYVMNLAREVSTRLGIPIDRMAQRYMSCTICWFCEHSHVLNL
jgi:hypothetical protein